MVGVVSPALGSSGEYDKQQTFRVVGVTAELDFIDLGDEGSSLGDEIVFSVNLWRHRKQVGARGCGVHSGVAGAWRSALREEHACNERQPLVEST